MQQYVMASRRTRPQTKTRPYPPGLAIGCLLATSIFCPFCMSRGLTSLPTIVANYFQRSARAESRIAVVPNKIPYAVLCKHIPCHVHLCVNSLQRRILQRCFAGFQDEFALCAHWTESPSVTRTQHVTRCAKASHFGKLVLYHDFQWCVQGRNRSLLHRTAPCH